MAASEEQIELIDNTGTMLDAMCKQLHTHAHKITRLLQDWLDPTMCSNRTHLYVDKDNLRVR